MDDERRRGRVSRRGLFGFLGRGFEGLKDGLAEAGDALRDQEPAAEPSDDLEMILRPAAETVTAMGDGLGRWNVHFEGPVPPRGGSVLVVGDDLPERVVVVRVDELHWSGCSSECPVDGSDLVWAATDDRLMCPSCDSRWRLDGEPKSGPANTRLARYFVDQEGHRLRIREA